MSANGLSYDVEMKMVSALEKQGYMVYTDKFYSSNTLFPIFKDRGLVQLENCN